MGDLEAAREGVHAADVGVEEVDRLVRFATTLGVEVEAALGEAAHLEDAQHDVRREVEVGRELVGVPAEERVAAVGVDGTEGVGAHRDFHLVLHRVAGERGVVGLEVQFEVLQQAVFTEEVEAGGRVGIVLVGRGFARLGLDEELTLEADLLRVVDGEVQERGEVVELTLHVGVDEGGVAFAAAPEDVTFAAEGLGGLERVTDLAGAVGEHVGVGRGARALRIARVGEETGGAPEELLAGALLVGLELLGDAGEVGVRLGQGLAFRRDVAVVEAVEVDLALLEELEEDRDTAEGVVEGVGTVIPGHEGRAGAERIGKAVAHHVPVGRGEAHVVLHLLSADLLVRIVVLEGERVLGLRSFELDDRDIREVRHV